MRKISLLGCFGVLTLGGLLGGACNGESPPAGSGGTGTGGTAAGGTAAGGTAAGGTAAGGSSTGGRSTGGASGGDAGGGGEAGGGGAPPEPPPSPPSCEEIESPDVGTAPGFSITSPAFEYCEPIPAAYTCDGKAFAEGSLPALAWTEGPPGTDSYAIVFKDLTLASIPDPVAYDHAFHWVIWGIPDDVFYLPAGFGATAGHYPSSVAPARQWAPFNNYRFMGPCPNPFAGPGGVPVPLVDRATDSYAFVVYALPDPINQIDVPGPEEGKSFVTVMDEYLQTIALAAAEYRGTSNAASITEPPTAGPPATPSPAEPCPSTGTQPVGCLDGTP